MPQDVDIPVKLMPNGNGIDRFDPGGRIKASRDQARWHLVPETPGRFLTVTKIEHALDRCKEKFNCQCDAPPDLPFSAKDIAELAKRKPVHRSGQPVPHTEGHTHLYKCTWTLFQDPKGQPIDVWDPDITIDWP